MGRREGSDAATPAWAATPALVTSPLQYAVAVKSTRTPGVGAPAGPGSGVWNPRGSIECFESRIVTSSSHTNIPAARVVANAFSQKDRAISIPTDESVVCGGGDA